MYLHTYINVIYIYVCVCVCVYIYICVCVCVCVCVFVYIHIYIYIYIYNIVSETFPAAHFHVLRERGGKRRKRGSVCVQVRCVCECVCMCTLRPARRSSKAKRLSHPGLPSLKSISERVGGSGARHTHASCEMGAAPAWNTRPCGRTSWRVRAKHRPVMSNRRNCPNVLSCVCG